MLKKLTIAFAAAAIVCASALPVSAQVSSSPLSYDAGIGLALPFGDLGDVSGAGFTIGGDVFLATIDAVPGLKLGGRLAYTGFGEDPLDVSILEIVPSVRYPLASSGKINYFLQGGFGLFIRGGDADGTRLGVTLGGGGVYPLANGLNITVMPLVTFADDTFMSINAGVLFGK